MNVLQRWSGALLLTLPTLSLAGSIEESQLGCLLEPKMEVAISSHVPGVVKSVQVERGQRVRRGQTLVELETSVDEAVVALANARAEFAQRKLERNSDLIEKGLLSTHEKDEIVTEQHIATLEVKEAEARLRQRTIRSPISGIVIERKIHPGEYVSAEPVMTLAALNPLYAELVMHADAYGILQKGMKVEIEVSGPITGRYTGKVTIVDQILDAASGTFGVRVELPNPKLKLPSGLKCQLHLLPEKETR